MRKDCALRRQLWTLATPVEDGQATLLPPPSDDEPPPVGLLPAELVVDDELALEPLSFELDDVALSLVFEESDPEELDLADEDELLDARLSVL